MRSVRERLVASPCSNPELPLDDALAAYRSAGYCKFEVFTHWVKSAADIASDPVTYADTGRRHEMRFTSFHLPPITEDVVPSLDQTLRAVHFARAIGASIVLFKATSRDLYVRSAGRFLDATAGLGVTPVLQNHAGSPLSTLQNVREVTSGIGDSRMKALLEVGHFHTVGVSWREAYDALGESIALLHIKDQIGPQSVPFGCGEVDLPGLFRHMEAVGYRGDYVVEMEVADPENTLRYMADAVRYVEEHWP